MLGLEAPAQVGAVSLAWDSAAVLGAWLMLIEPLDLETLTAPTPSRGRSLRNLTVNVFHPFELLPIAFESGRFDWDPSGDEGREEALGQADAVIAYAADRHLGWQHWLQEREDDLSTRDPVVTSSRGTVTYTNLVDSQRWHAAYHYRQVLAFLERGGYEPTGTLSLASLRGLKLPAEIF